MSTPEDEISYREFVQRCAKEKQPSPDDYEALENYRAYLKISPDRARAIEQEVLGSQIIPPRTTDQLDTQTILGNESPINQPKPDDLSKKLNQLDASNKQNIDLETQNIANGLAIDDITQPPTGKPENYFAHLEQYGKDFLQALRTEGFNLSEETRERLRKFAKQYELVGSDVADTERKMLVELYLTTGQREAIEEPPIVPPPPVTIKTPVEPKYDIHLEPFFEELEGCLKANDLKAADIATCDILLEVIKPSERWFDEASLKKFKPTIADKKAIQEIDHLWKQKSSKFGFSRQLQIYGSNHIASQEADLDKQQRDNRRYTLLFAKEVQWWLNGLEFFKFYNQLNFSMEKIENIPDGHLPARWFWEIPRSKAFQHGGLGILTERGGCGLDSFILPAFMYMLRNSDIHP